MNILESLCKFPPPKQSQRRTKSSHLGGTKEIKHNTTTPSKTTTQNKIRTDGEKDEKSGATSFHPRSANRRKKEIKRARATGGQTSASMYITPATTVRTTTTTSTATVPLSSVSYPITSSTHSTTTTTSTSAEKPTVQQLCYMYKGLTKSSTTPLKCENCKNTAHKQLQCSGLSRAAASNNKWACNVCDISRDYKESHCSGEPISERIDGPTK